MQELNERPAPGSDAGRAGSERTGQGEPASSSNYREMPDKANPPPPAFVVAFEPNGCAHGAAVPAFLAAHRGRDIYWLPGTAKEPASLRTTPRKDEMLGAELVWADIDPPTTVWRNGAEVEPGALGRWRERTVAELFNSRVPVSRIDFSGRGIWGYWRLDAIAAPDDVEAVNRALAKRHGGDKSGVNINKVARMPGTLNSKTGEEARTIFYSAERVYRISDFERIEAAPAIETTKCSAAVTPIKGLDELAKYKVPTTTLLVIAQGTDPDKPDRFPSRSEAVFYVCCELVRRSVPDDIILGILLDLGFGIADSIYRTKSGAPVSTPEEYARRQVEKAHDAVARAGAAPETAKPAEFEVDKNGLPYKTQHNIRVALAKLGVTVKHDTFQDRMLVEGLPGCGPLLDDRAATRLWLLIEERFKFRPAKDFFFDVVADAASQSAFHPVRDYLDGLSWDGKARLDTWLTVYGEAKDTPYLRAIGALLLVAAVRRIRQPGCKFDEMPVLEGGQGTGKSSALAALATRDEWFSDDLPLNADSKRVIESLAGRWLVEAAELKGMRKGEVEHLKAFMSRQVDRARMSYGRLVTEVPRQCVIVGTTNSSQYLRDGTGNRRFWPVRVGRFDLAALRRDRDQIWAEAAAREAAGASIRLDPKLWADAAAEQQQRHVEEPYVNVFAEVLGDLKGKLKTEDAFRILKLPAAQRTQEHNARLGEAMRELGFTRVKARFGAKSPEWAYVRGTKDDLRNRIVVEVDDKFQIAVKIRNERGQAVDDASDTQDPLPF